MQARVLGVVSWHVCLVALFAVQLSEAIEARHFSHGFRGRELVDPSPGIAEVNTAAALTSALEDASIADIILTSHIILPPALPASTPPASLLPPILGRAVSISGTGCLAQQNASCVLDAGPAATSRLFSVGDGGELELSGVTLLRGNALKGGGGAVKVDAGGVLRCHDVVMRGHNASDGGGAVQVLAGGRVHIIDSVLEGNAAKMGGAMHAGPGSYAVLNGSLFTRNSAVENGGALVMEGPVTLVEGTSPVFFENVATLNGGALSLASGARATLTSATFLANRALRTGGGVFAGQEAVFHTVNTVFQNNTSGERGAGIAATLGANITLILAYASSNVAAGFGGFIMAKDAGTTVTIEGGEYARNVGDWGGTLFFEFGARALVNDALFLGNRALVGGGVLYTIGIGTQASFSGCSFVDNVAVSVGGALLAFTGSQVTVRDILCKGSWASQFGGCVQVLGTTFTIKNLTCIGNYAGTGGGCLYFFRSLEVLVEGAVFVNNSSGRFGGGLYGWSAGPLVLRNARFEDNHAGVSGGAIGLLDASSVTVSNVVVFGSSAPSGGAISVKGKLTLNNGSFVDNHAETYGGFMEVTGGGQVNLTCVTVVGSTAGLGGGAMHVTGAGSVMEVANDTTFSGCMAPDGGALLLSAGGMATLRSGSIFRNNTAGRCGGGVCVRGQDSLLGTRGHVVMMDNAVVNAGGCGGAVGVVNGSSGMLLGSIVIVQNYAPFGGGACVLGNGSSLVIEAQFSPLGINGFVEAVVQGNTAMFDGGGILLAYGALGSFFKGSLVQNSAARDGGGVCASQPPELLSAQGISTPAMLPSAQLMVNGISLQDNVAQRDGGGFFLGDHAQGTLKGCTMVENAARSQGGGILARDQGTFLSVQGGTMSHNSAGLGGGAIGMVAGARVFLQGPDLEGNEAAGHGGALFMGEGSQLQSENCSIIANMATHNGGGLYVTGESTSAWLRDGMLDSNWGGQGGGAYIVGGGHVLMDRVLLRDNSADSGWGHAVLAIGRDSQFWGSNCSLEARGAQVPLSAPGQVAVSKDSDLCVLTPSSYSAVSGGAADLERGWLAMGQVDWLEQHLQKLSGGQGPMHYSCSQTLGKEVEVADFKGLFRVLVEEFLVGILRLTADIVMDTPAVINRKLQIIGACQQEWGGSGSNNTRPCRLRPLSSTSMFSIVDGGNLLLQNLVLSGGRGTDGGALQVSQGGILLCNSVTFQNNSALKGGAISVVGGHASFTSCVFEGNAASQRGGAISAEAAANIFITGSIATANAAPSGGVIYATGVETNVASQDGMYLNNSARQAGGVFGVTASARAVIRGGTMATNSIRMVANSDTVLEGAGGAVFMSGQGTTVTLEGGCLLDGNTAGTGGAVYAEAGALLLSSGATFQNCLAYRSGGALATDGAATRLQLASVAFLHNLAWDQGGALTLAQGAVGTLSSDILFHQNVAQQGGGAVDASGTGTALRCQGCAFDANRAWFRGGAISLSRGATASVTSGVMVANMAGELGGACYGVDSDTRLVLSHTHVEHSQAGVGGGALYLTSSATAEVTRCTFFNGSAPDGGAMALEGAGTRVACTESSFRRNHAALLGGVAFLTTGASCFFHIANFTENSVGDRGRGGVGFAQNLGTSVISRGCSYVANVASGGGGGWFLLGGPTMTSEADNYDSNIADKGGAIAAVEFDTRFEAKGCMFAHNRAKGDGGAIYLASVGACSLQGCVLLQNAAKGQGGAVYWGGGSIMGRSVANQYLGNTARSGGAIALVSESALEVSVGDIFAGNSAERVGGGVYVVGGSSAIFWSARSLPSDVTVSWDSSTPESKTNSGDCTFDHNQAPFGGGIYVSCVKEGGFGSSGEPATACVSLYGCAFFENMAVGGCGGAVWSSKRASVNISCSENSTNGEISASESGAAHGCATWVGNAAVNGGYGPHVCTPGTSLFLLPAGADLSAPLPDASINSTLQISDHRSGAELSGISVVLADAYNQVVSTERGLLLSAQIIAASINGSGGVATEVPGNGTAGTGVSTPLLSGRLIHTFLNGLAHVKDVFLTAPPGYYAVGFYSVGYESRARARVATRACLPGEVHVAGACKPCLAPLFSWDPSNETCDVCPPNAECYGSHVVVPHAGYWQASRLSYHMHRCLRPDACNFANRSQVIADALRGDGAWDPDVQCSQGYRGVLCAECEDGFSRSPGRSCSSCHSKWHYVTVYIIVTTASAAVIAAVVWVALTLARFRSAEEADRYLLGPLVKISVSWLHILGIMCQVSTTRLTPLTRFAEILADVSSGPGDQAVPLECLLDSYTGAQRQFYITGFYILLPIALVLSTALLWLLYGTILSVYHHGNRMSLASYVAPRALASTLAIAFTLWPRAVFHALQLLQCHDAPRGVRGSPYYEAAGVAPPGSYWDANRGQRCFHGAHLAMVLSVGLASFLIYCAAFPLYMILSLSYGSKSTTDEVNRPGFPPSLEDSSSPPPQSVSSTSLRFLYVGYRHGMWWMDLLAMAQKGALLAMVLVLSLVGSSTQLQLFTFLVMITLYAVIHNHLRPYSRAPLNRIQHLAWTGLIVSNVLLLLFHLSPMLANWWHNALKWLLSVAYIVWFVGLLAVLVRYAVPGLGADVNRLLPKHLRLRTRPRRQMPASHGGTNHGGLQPYGGSPNTSQTPPADLSTSQGSGEQGAFMPLEGNTDTEVRGTDSPSTGEDNRQSLPSELSTTHVWIEGSSHRLASPSTVITNALYMVPFEGAK